MRQHFLPAMILAAVTLAFSVGSSGATETDFTNPKIGSNRLDWCYNWGVGCGKQAADAWCKSKGFDESSDSAMAADIGASQPTRLIGTGAVCDQAFCDGFTHITCKTATPQNTTFWKPKFQGNWLDWCYDWGTGCGTQAATAWCKTKGFTVATGFAMAPDIGLKHPTRLIGTGAICDQGYCDGFKSITCAK